MAKPGSWPLINATEFFRTLAVGPCGVTEPALPFAACRLCVISVNTRSTPKHTGNASRSFHVPILDSPSLLWINCFRCFREVKRVNPCCRPPLRLHRASLGPIGPPAKPMQSRKLQRGTARSRKFPKRRESKGSGFLPKISSRNPSRSGCAAFFEDSQVGFGSEVPRFYNL